MGLFDSIAAYLAPSAYADNQAEPQESSSKAYGEPNVSDDSEGRKGEPDEAKNVHTTTKSTDAGVDEDEKTDNEGEETVDGAVVESGDAEEAEEAEDEPEEEEEEEEDEPVDIMPKIEAGESQYSTFPSLTFSGFAFFRRSCNMYNHLSSPLTLGHWGMSGPIRAI